jgi:inorganic pyrophosphatase
MSLSTISSGDNIPYQINVIIEIPKNATPIKYEVDKDTASVWVDRFMSSPMFYPANYGYINNTLAEDGDPVDVLVVTPYPLAVGCVIKCRPIGILNMTDDGGKDAKVIALPIDKLTPIYKEIDKVEQIPLLKEQIEHFFSQYKSLESGKWVKIEGWSDAEGAHTEITNGISRYQKNDNS